MKSYRTPTALVAGIFILAVAMFRLGAQPAAAPSSPPVYVPDYSHANEPMADNVLVWDATTKSVEGIEGEGFAKFEFNFTNTAQNVNISFTTNADNSVTSSTNVEPATVVILNVHPSCGCTTAELPPTPWMIPPGSNGMIKLSVNLAGKQGSLFKTASVTTDRGNKTLMLRIDLHPAPVPTLTEDQRMAGMIAAKADRQAVFKGDCATCHVPKIEGMYGPQLFHATCAICHEAENRATMVPDLAKLKVPTDREFWKTWITFGKPGSLMPAFATSQGGPLSDFQIASLAAYLDQLHPSTVTNPAAN
jgi:mono/diheme cytochrome c family protein